MDAFISAFETLGYIQCDYGDLEDGYEKIALYAIHENNIAIPTHAAKQMPDGKWTSKLGRLEDIVHITPQDVECRSYGEVVGLHETNIAVVVSITVKADLDSGMEKHQREASENHCAQPARSISELRK